MALDFWKGLNVGMEIDEDENGLTCQFVMDHDELKGDLFFEIKTLLDAELSESFDTADDAGAIQDSVLPEYESMKKYFEECIDIINEKIAEAKGFIEENS